ncbi:hypothetical protein I4U23_021876 [Adineta vaga]|nr:hypothetical protein I4U23_021876 [Adineta vaga]
MTWIKILILFFIVILEQSIGQNIRSFQMHIINEHLFQCITTTCLPYSNNIVSNIFQCQINCLSDIQCRAASFHQFNSTCQLFNNTTDNYNNLEIVIGSVTMIVISKTQITSGK